MIVGVLKEARAGETRVAATPTTVAALQKLGYEVVVDPGAGEQASFTDDAYAAAGARLGDPLAADVVIGVNPPTLAQRDRLKPGTTLIAMLNPRLDEDIVADLTQRPITALSMDAVPRISRAQSMDVLSSMANVAGYRAVVEAAHEFGRMFTGQVTAAGKMPPARVFVVGAGVAGLAAIGAASAMGAIVRAFDVRPEVAEQVESMGAEFVKVDFEAEVSTDGYAKEMTAEQQAATAAMYDAETRAADIVITTALIPGRPAPKLITEETIAAMRYGSVIVDMAAANGGNAALTKTDERIVTDNGVKILGYTDLAGRLPSQTSQLYGTNIVNLIKLLTPGKDGQLVLDFDDVVQRGITVVRDGESTWPPPPVQVSAAPRTPTVATAPAAEPKAPMSPGQRLAVVSAAAAVLFLLIGLAPQQLQLNLTVFALAIVIGYYVIGHVHHALHTPLMSVTNAISGIIVVGALLQIGKGDTAITVISFAAVLLASINIFGGFAVTRRMLAMFSRS
ncbi:Re/Si-specific NAD(P)(+) transhydrogenase subunit alpha [Mycobacterium paraintracellulare]|uniref:Re/Si-specific NAD(P)(+) transhydrogenase subunit alpha n=1 Tax=Mycobacterium paraintracellulare TaxID=1138383 RepID=UPI0019286722|nr:Re/Si-specific NAD(P)(+) transhydrogenase subunit alpha [Mycobacterium paraintracellulare]BCP14071.1 NAD(P) transhydrogenase subunit alpha [Mycobacterium paraintracellulare]